MKTDATYLLNWPQSMAQAVSTLAQTRGQSVADYIRQAIQRQLIWDGAQMDYNALRQAIEHGTEKTTVAANFAAIHAQAVLIFLREWRKEDMKRQEGLPEELARQTVQCDVDDAIAESIRTFEDPRVRQQYAWVERPQSADDLPDWLTEDEAGDVYDDLTNGDGS